MQKQHVHGVSGGYIPIKKSGFAIYTIFNDLTIPTFLRIILYLSLSEFIITRFLLQQYYYLHNL